MSDEHLSTTPAEKAKDELTPEQRGVVDSASKDLVVTAAAGAGKTRVLVERYLRHVSSDGLRPDQILTITFTKRAAAEMKNRIVKALREKGDDENAQIAETGPIQTIHSFCERLLRENSLEAGLDPEFEILSESHSNGLVLSSIRDALASASEDEPHAERLIGFLAGKPQAFGDAKGPYARLEQAISRVLGEMRSSGVTRDELTQWYASPSALRRHWENHIVRMQPPPVRLKYPEAEGSSIQERLQQAFALSGEKPPAILKGKPNLAAEEEGLVHACGLVQLAASAWWRLEQRFQELQSLDFTALEARAVGLLERSVPTCERISRQYNVVMVDEAQDVNPIQYRLLDRLNVERTMMVGDIQQSIYGFRQADVSLFQNRAQGRDQRRLSRNFRSEAGILEFVDVLFGNLWQRGSYVPMSQVKPAINLDEPDARSFEGVEIWRMEAKDFMGLARYARELLDEGKYGAGDMAFLVRDGVGAVAVKSALAMAGIESRIVGGSERFYTRIEVRDLANALRASADRDDDFALLACLRSPMASLSLDSIVLLGTLPGVYERLADFEPPVESDRDKLARFLGWFVPLTRYADRLSAWEVLSEILAKSPYLETIARRDQAVQLLANVRKLLSLATDEPDLGPLEYAERIREIQELRHKEGDAPASEQDNRVASIMTVHKAKGLEFKVVVVCQTDKPLNRKASDVIVEHRNGLVATRLGAEESLMRKLLVASKKDREYEEELRLLYVALTRAQKRLCVALYPPSRSGMTASKLISGVFGDTFPPDVVVREPKKN